MWAIHSSSPDHAWAGARRLGGVVAITVMLLGSSTGVAVASTPQRIRGGGQSVALRYTEYGIPHIRAVSWFGLGYGTGYGQARDGICTLADAYVTVDGNRSRFFGADGSYVNGGASTVPVNNLNSDLFYRQLNGSRVIERQLAQPYPLGPAAQMREAVRGFVAGYNRYLADTGVRRLPDPTCRGASWVHPITVIEAYRRIVQVTLLGSSGNAIDGIGSATPPAPGAAQPAVPGAAVPSRLQAGEWTMAAGSNAIAVGAGDTANRRGLLLANPHFPWAGAQRFWQSQQTVPGQLDVMGATEFGLPINIIGHNATVAWTHTVATYRPFTLYQVTLAPGNPTSYLVDGRVVPMSRRTITVAVRQPDGRIVAVTRTLYSTRWGSVTTAFSGLPVPLPWTSTTAYTIQDANLGQLRGLNTWLEFNQAKRATDLLGIERRTQGLPFVNTIAADAHGAALFMSMGVTADVSDAKAAACNTPLGTALFAASGIAVLDGSRSSCAWGRDPGALEPGTMNPARMPYLLRDDWVENSNNSPWLTNPAAPLTGYPRIVGDIGTARSLRTRQALRQIPAWLAGGKFTRQSMQRLVFNDDVLAGHLAAADTAAMCRAFPNGTAPSSTGPVPVGGACAAIADWDRHANLDSRGALLFYRFWERLSATVSPFPWKVPFDPAHPITTPNTLDTGNHLVQVAFGDAINDLRGAHLPFDAPLRQGQYVTRESGRIPLHGGPESVGVLNKLAADWDPATGYSNVTYRTSSSFVMVTSFNGTACPDSRTLLTYGQSPNPVSPHSDDQTRLFAHKRWVVDRFCERDIRTSPQLYTIRLRY